MATGTVSAPGVQTSLSDSINVERLTCTIGAELSGVTLGDAARDNQLFAEVRSLLLQHKVLFLSHQTSPAPSTSPLRGASVSWRTTQ